jgi:hypothetical protein
MRAFRRNQSICDLELMISQKVPKAFFPSFRRKPESRQNEQLWTPASAGVTALMTFCEIINLQCPIIIDH